MLILQISLDDMKYCALILMSSLPAAWIAVGCLLLILVVVLAVLFALKLREVATLKKEVYELRDTMRMMRYEETNLARMLHTASSKPKEQIAEQRETQPEMSVMTPIEDVVKETYINDTVEEASIEEIAEDIILTESIIKEVAPIEDTQEEYTKAETTTIVMENEERETIEESLEEEAEETVAEAQTFEETIEEPVEESISEPSVAEAIEEDTTDTIFEEPSVPIVEEEELPTSVEESTDVADTESNEVEVEEKRTETEEVATAEEEGVEEIAEEGVEEEMEVEEIKPTQSPYQKHPINERRPAIPTDLFAAWFAEYEDEPANEFPAEETFDKAETVAPSTIETPAATVTDIARPTVAITAPDEQAKQETATIENTTESAAEISAEIPEMNKEDERFCRKLERIVTTRLRNPNLNIDIIAAQFGIGRTNFYRKVRELTGMSPNDYLRKCRMERAAELLCSSTEPVSDICAQVGIPDAQYFSRVFKTFYGVTPSAYRENNKIIE